MDISATRKIIQMKKIYPIATIEQPPAVILKSGCTLYPNGGMEPKEQSIDDLEYFSFGMWFIRPV